MVHVDRYALRDRQFKTLKNIALRIARKTGLDLGDIEDFVLKQEFFRVLHYDAHVDVFVRDFEQFLHARMHGLLPRGSTRSTMLNKRLWGRQ